MTPAPRTATFKLDSRKRRSGGRDGPGCRAVRTRGVPRAKKAALTQVAVADVLQDHVVVEPVHRTRAPVARLLHAAERRGLGRESAFVDADKPALQCLRDPPDALHVRR